MKYRPLSYGVILAATVGPALADDLRISDTVRSPVTTSAASNGTPGNVTITEEGLIRIDASGAVVTINSNNTVENTGLIESFADSNAIGLHILGGNTGSFIEHTNPAGGLAVVGEGTGNIGILVDGSAPFFGNITLEPGGVIAVHGKDSVGLAINTPVNGNVSLGGVSGFGIGTKGVVVAAPITGSLSSSGNILLLSFLDQTKFSPANIDPVTGPAFSIGASISGGFLNAGTIDTFDATSVAGSIQVSSSDAAIVIAPSVLGAAASNVTIGAFVTDAGSPTFSFINRGSIVNAENDPTLSTTGIRIGEHAAGAPAHTTVLTGGMVNSGLIQAESRSDTVFANRTTAVPTDATAIEIGNGATIGAFSYSQAAAGGSTSTIVLDPGASTTNNFYRGLVVRLNGQDRLITAYDGASRTATITAFNGSPATWASAPQATDTFTIRSGALQNNGQIFACQPQCIKTNTGVIQFPGPENGTITGILIQPLASVPSLINTGTIAAQGFSSDPRVTGLASYAVRDLSGTLTDIANSGTIAVTASSLNDGSQKAVALDLSAGTVNQRVTDSGTIAGDVYFGSAGMNGGAAGNQLTIEGAQASVSGSVRSTGSGTLDIHVSPQGTGGSLVTANSRTTALDVGAAGQLFFVISKLSQGAPTISAAGNVTYGTGALSALRPASFLPNGTYTLIDAGGTLHIGDTSTFDLSSDANRSTFGIPFLYKASLTTDNNSTVTNDGKSLKLTLARKTAEEIGLTGDGAIMFEPLMAAALTDDALGISLLGLSSQSDVQTTLNSTVPDIAGGVRALAVALTDEATGFIAARQRQLLTAPQGSRNEFRFWAQEFYNNVQQDRTASSPGFGGAGQGVALGAEWGSLATVRYGVGLSFFSSQETELHPRDTKTDGDWGMASAYAAWRVKNFFIAPQINVASGGMESRRGLIVNSSTDVRKAAAKWQSYLGAGGLTGGYIVNLGAFQIMPTVAFDALYLHESAYSEDAVPCRFQLGDDERCKAIGGAALRLNANNQKSARAFAGIIGQGTFAHDEGVFLPQVIAGWSHEFINDPVTIDGAFESAPGSPFHLVGPTLEPNRIVGGMSFGYVLRNWTAGVNYDASANSGALAQSATVSLSSRF